LFFVAGVEDSFGGVEDVEEGAPEAMVEDGRRWRSQAYRSVA
jgi:hypothetical protein